MKCQYCGRELEIKEIQFPNFKDPIRIPRECECISEKKKEERILLEKQEKAERARDIVYDGYLSNRFVEASFSKDNQTNEQMSKVLAEYCCNWESNKRKNVGLYLFGNTGSGKTFYASAIANYIRKEYGDHLLIGSSSDYIQKMTEDYRKNWSAMAYKISHYKLMVIDDLGAEEESKQNLAVIEQIIDMRCDSKLPIIVTSNYKPSALYEEGGLLGERIKSRLSGMCIPYLVVCEDRRKGQASARAKQME